MTDNQPQHQPTGDREAPMTDTPRQPGTGEGAQPAPGRRVRVNLLVCGMPAMGKAAGRRSGRCPS